MSLFRRITTYQRRASAVNVIHSHFCGRYFSYRFPNVAVPSRLGNHQAALIASGDSRQSANDQTWPTQQQFEQEATRAFQQLGWSLQRRHPTTNIYDDATTTTTISGTHGFIASQAQGREVFQAIHPDDPLVIIESVWQFSHHVLIGLVQRHRGPILLLANWSGTFPGLVGALSLRASLTKAGVVSNCSFLWGEDFTDATVQRKLTEWCQTGTITHDLSHVQELGTLPSQEQKLGQALADELRHRPAILGCFDEGCMGMFHAIMPDHLLNQCNVFKERLSQSALYFAMTQQVTHTEAEQVYQWIINKGMTFRLGTVEETELTERQVLEQCRMYIAAARMADEFGCDAIGIQFQLGLKDWCAASDLAEGLLNCSDRPPVYRHQTTNGNSGNGGNVIRPNLPITHFNEVDEGAGLDGLLTHRVWSAMNLLPDNTLHDLRWGESFGDDFVWVLEISGSVPPSHFENGYHDAVGERQPAMYFAKGGSTIKGISKPGEVVWSRIYVQDNSLHMDIGRCESVSLPREESERRWALTTSEWPMMHAVTYGVSRDQMMAKHQANHLQVAYGNNAESADRALTTKAAMAQALGINVHLCGTSKCGTPLAEHLANMN